MPNEKELIELKLMLQTALDRIEKLENQLQMKKTKLYRYFIPEYGADNKKVPEEKRMDYLNVLQEASCKDNGGYTMYQGIGGYYPGDLSKEPFDAKKIVKENVLIFDTYGSNPMTPERLKHCQQYLYQNSLGIMSNDSYEFIDSNRIGIYTIAKADKKPLE